MLLALYQVTLRLALSLALRDLVRAWSGLLLVEQPCCEGLHLLPAERLHARLLGR